MEAIEVLARFDSQGRVNPMRFIWQGSAYPVDSIGRRWVDETGQHILVMIPKGDVFELIFDPLSGRWYLEQVGKRGAVA